MRCPRRVWIAWLLLIGFTISAGPLGCAASSGAKPRLAYSPRVFRETVLDRIPTLPDDLADAPFVIERKTIERARRQVMRAPPGPPRVQALLDFLSQPAPNGLGLVYAWQATGSAKQTIERGQGNCVSLASVLVGLGRGLGWPIYYAEARTRRPETQEFEEVVAVSDHMAVVVVAKTVQMIIDFTGLVEDIYQIRPIDDITAYAHILNNITAQSLMTQSDAANEATWDRAIRGFELATRIEPSLGRSWNNLGIALARRGRFDEARLAYQRAVSLDTAFGSATRNLTIMETRALGESQLLTQPAATDR